MTARRRSAAQIQGQNRLDLHDLHEWLYLCRIGQEAAKRIQGPMQDLVGGGGVSPWARPPPKKVLQIYWVTVSFVKVVPAPEGCEICQDLGGGGGIRLVTLGELCCTCLEHFFCWKLVDS